MTQVPSEPKFAYLYGRHGWRADIPQRTLPRRECLRGQHSLDFASASQGRVFKMMKPVTGRCFCGAVRFQFDRLPVATRACWCRDCQYLSSGNASVNAIFKTEGFRFTGEVNEHISTADSGNVERRRFCPKCGTQLFSELLSRSDIMVVRAGVLDDPEIGRPASYIWTASAPRWVVVDPEPANCEGQPAAIPRN